MSSSGGWAARILAAASTLVLGAVLWTAAAYLLTAPLGAIYGWSGHPPLPGAPTWVWVLLYLVLLPMSSLTVAWCVVRALLRAGARRRTQREMRAPAEGSPR